MNPRNCFVLKTANGVINGANKAVAENECVCAV